MWPVKKSKSTLKIKFMQLVKENPTLIAACLVYGEKMQLENAPGFARLLETVVLSIFGQSCATQNQTPLLEFIQCLMLHQIGSTDKASGILSKISILRRNSNGTYRYEKYLKILTTNLLYMFRYNLLLK